MKPILSVLKFGIMAIIWIAMVWLTAWGSVALWFKIADGGAVLMAIPVLYGLLGLSAVLGFFWTGFGKLAGAFTVAAAALLIWWNTLEPPTTGDWSREVAQQTTGTIEGDILTLSDVRNFTWRSLTDFDESWEERTYDLSQINSVDLLMSYWAGPHMGHLMITFGFEDGRYLTWSNEVRRSTDASFSPLADFFKTNPIAIIAAEEQDVVGYRSNIQEARVHVFRLADQGDEARSLLAAYVAAANAVAEEPQWFNSLFSNCSRSVVTLTRSIGIDLPLDFRVLVNGYLPEYLYDLGALDRSVSIEELYELGDITERAAEAWQTPGYSDAIRVGVPEPSGPRG
ncbi:MAG: DUF4105 domain-containing protein [Pseudomonadota bacterium]